MQTRARERVTERRHFDRERADVDVTGDPIIEPAQSREEKNDKVVILILQSNVTLPLRLYFCAGKQHVHTTSARMRAHLPFRLLSQLVRRARVLYTFAPRVLALPAFPPFILPVLLAASCRDYRPSNATTFSDWMRVARRFAPLSKRGILTMYVC